MNMTQDMHNRMTIRRDRTNLEFAPGKVRLSSGETPSFLRGNSNFAGLLPKGCKNLRFFYYLACVFLMLIMGAGQMWGQNLTGSGTETDPYIIADATDFSTFATNVNANTDGASTKFYKITGDIQVPSSFATISSFSGTLTSQAKDDGTFPIISNLSVPIFATATNATISNIMLKSVTISQAGYVGAIACTANGTTRIYNCGILPNTAKHESTNRSTVASTDNHCGSLVGYLDGSARVINCFSYANVSAKASDNKHAGGLVGYNTTCSDQRSDHLLTMVVNCMFYGDITQGHIKRPVYGGTAILNTNTQDSKECGLNNYNYFSEEDATFTGSLDKIAKYFCTWPVAKKHLMRFDVYRNLLNSNRRLCTWWVNGTYNVAPTDADVTNVGIAKWVLDPTIAPYPILKKWGKYYSNFDHDPNNVFHVETNTTESRSTAKEWEGKSYGTLRVIINGGTNNSSVSTSRDITITDMDTLGYDYCAKKIQLPYYNEVFGNPNGDTWAAKYGNNYTSKVVTGWKIIAISGGTPGTFDGSSENAWETGYNFADRKCTNKDKFDVSGRVFAQGGYYYVPDGVDGITIEAYWGDAVYLRNINNRLDRVNNASNDFSAAGELKFAGNTGVLPNWPSGNTLKNSLSGAVSALTAQPTKTVYDQAIVLVSSYQQNNFHSNITLDGSTYDTNAKPFTIMSADFDFDNEPDFCFQAGMSGGGRVNAHPIRFDFLYLPDLTMTARVDTKYYGMRIFCPQGHFEITETSYMYTTQFEYDMRPGTENGYKIYMKHEAPVILNGGEHFQIVSAENRGTGYNETETNKTATWRLDRTSYFLVGGNVYLKAFTPGTHGNRRLATRHCAVNVIGGECPEFYLSGMFNANFFNMPDNPHAYLDGGKFGTVAGAGMENVDGNVTFKINRSWIKEFYGGGINANRPVTGSIDVTIDNSLVHKYCGGPKVGDMSNTNSITNTASNTIFDQFFGGGNGGTNNERKRIKDSNGAVDAPTSPTNSSPWEGEFGFQDFSPLNYTDGGYETEFEFELLPYPSGGDGKGYKVVKRTYHYLASFARTMVAPVTNIITDCTFKANFYGGGNLGAVAGPDNTTDPIVTSTLKGHTIVHGSVFGAGFSASIPSFRVHDESRVTFPYRDVSGFIHDGKLEYAPTYYTWINDVPSDWGINPAPTTTNANHTFEYKGKSYVYTPESLEGLGTVKGNVSLTIEGTTEIDEDVYGGGDASAVDGNTTVTLQGNATVTGNVFGGGNSGEVSGSATVNIEQ